MRPIIAAFIILLGFNFPCPATEFYVAPGGNDQADGSRAAPFATLARARDAIRQLKADGPMPGPVQVVVRGGVYELAETFTLEAADAGTSDAPITYHPEEGGRVVLLGGRSVTGFEPGGEGGPGEGPWVARAAGLGQGCRLLVFDGERQELARYPNRDPADINGGEWAYVAGTRIDMYADMPGTESYQQTHQHLDYWQRNDPRHCRSLRMQAADLRSWRHPTDGEISIFPRFNWWHYVVPIESVDAPHQSLQLGSGSFYEIRPGDRYFVRNLGEELDAPGEWYYDHRTEVLHFWPPGKRGVTKVSVATLDNIVRLQDCRHVTLRGFTMECCHGSAVVLTNCRNCLVAGNTIRNVGDYAGHGVTITQGQENGIVGNDIYACGGHGINLGGGDVQRLSCAGNYADNNYIHHVGVVGRYAKGIEMTGAGNRATHNLIHDTPQSGIYLWGSKHLVEFNHLRHTCLEGEDTGAIGGGAIDWLSWQETVLRYNFIHDTFGFGYDQRVGAWRSPYFTWALYPDWAASGVEIVGNILARAPRGLIYMHSGRDNTIANNILIDGGENQVDIRGWTTSTGYWATKVEEWTANYLRATEHESWRRVPTLRDPRTVPLPNGFVMHGNRFERNILCYSQPAASLFRFENAPLDRNRSDHNVIHHFGLPLRTGFLTRTEASPGPNLLANADLEEGPANGLPQGWAGVTPVAQDSAARVVEDAAHAGQRSLCVQPGARQAGDRVIKQLDILIGSTSYAPHDAFLFSAWLKSSQPGGQATLTAFSWKEQTHNWSATKSCGLDDQWRQYELLIRLPGPGDVDYQSTMERLWCRLSFPADGGVYWVDDVALRQVKVADEWAAWRAAGMDQNSVVADPLFLAPQQDDYRLAPASPALSLGFQPIPVDEIGPYASPLRVTWPILEARGAREAVQD